VEIFAVNTYLFIVVFNNNDIPQKEKEKNCIEVSKSFSGCALLQCYTSSAVFLLTMGNHRISDDLKEAALRLQDDGHSTAYIKQIAGSISKSMLYCAQKRKHTTGSVAKAQAIGHSRPRSLLKTDADYLLHLAQHKPTLFLDKYTHRLELY
jgi:hypothetical protein